MNAAALRRALRPLAEVPWIAARHFVRDDCTLHAAAIAYYSLLSLAPALYLVAHVLSLVVPDADAPERIVRLLTDVLPPAAMPTVEVVQEALTVHGGLVLVALPGLLWIATNALHAFQGALNVAFGRRPRGVQLLWRGARLKSFVVLIGGAVFLGLLLVLDAGLVLVERFGERYGVPVLPGSVVGALSFFAAPALTFAVFVLFYRLLPTGRCGTGPAMTGALAATLLWEIAQRLFGLVLHRSPAFGLLTGALASVLAFLVWIYLGVAIVLFGAEIAAVVNGDRGAREGPEGRTEARNPGAPIA